ncbi:MAG: glycosyltransferase family 2 protein [Clostridia bacterium]
MQEHKFLFSIIVPVYNTGKYIEKCLKSIQTAMDEDCEVIIVNDGSTDNSEQVIKKFIEELPENYKDNFVYTKKQNKGLADTKNVGIEMARGKFISVVDSDDYISDDFYTIARKYVNEYDIIIYDLYIVFEKSRLSNYTSRAYRDEKENYLVALLNGDMSGSSCNKIIKKELYNNYKFPVGKQYEDTAVTPFILSDTEKIKYVPYPMYYYLQREKSIVSSNTLVSAFYKICENISAVLRENKKDLEKYKYVINEFFVDRTLDILSQELTENKKDFSKNIQEFAEKNKEVIEYIVKSNLVYKAENHYSERQKNVTNKIFTYLKDAKYSKISNLLYQRKVINRARKILSWR